MIRPALFGLICSAAFVAACSGSTELPGAPPDSAAAPTLIPITQELPPQSLVEPVPVSATPRPMPTPTSAGPQFEIALSGGGPEALYAVQDISIIGQTGNVQLLNVYANW